MTDRKQGAGLSSGSSAAVHKAHCLKLNTDKTDLLHTGYSEFTSRVCIDNVNIGFGTVKNLGIIFDSSLSFLPHIPSTLPFLPLSLSH